MTKYRIILTADEGKDSGYRVVWEGYAETMEELAMTLAVLDPPASDAPDGYRLFLERLGEDSDGRPGLWETLESTRKCGEGEWWP